jgi:hypothetical protein
VYQQVWDGDLRDFNWHPPKGYDGTPPESAADVLTRMRQLLSVTETQYTGEVRHATNSFNYIMHVLQLLKPLSCCTAWRYGSNTHYVFSLYITCLSMWQLLSVTETQSTGGVRPQ